MRAMPKSSAIIGDVGRLLTLIAALSCPACGSSGDSARNVTGRPSRNVTQGGPQDISEFRAVLDAGNIPDLKLLDEVGFFAEHALDLPVADCGDPVCIHPMLAVAPRFDGGNWSMAFAALNTALDPATVPRLPRHLIIVLEDSLGTRPLIPTFKVLAQSLAPALSAEDRVSVVVAGEQSRLLADAASGDELSSVSLGARPEPNFDLYLALSTAHELAIAAGDSYARRVLLFTTGVIDTGVYQAEHYLALAKSLAQNSVAISTFGMGSEYQREIPMLLADVGSGNYYFVRDSFDLSRALRVEAETAFVPVAKNLELRVEAQPGYTIGRVYGARRASVTPSAALVETPTLFLGAREGSSDVSSGRRGGGGGWFVELVAEVPPGGNAAEPAAAFALGARYEDAQTAEPVETATTLVTPLGVGRNPDPTAPFFSDADRAKAFMMLNMYLAMHTAISLYESGKCGAAVGVKEMMAQSYEYWKAVYADPDIDEDWLLLQRLSEAIDQRCDVMTVRPVDVPYGCFMF
jgi:Ca-activated chloride channel family protein